MKIVVEITEKSGTLRCQTVISQDDKEDIQITENYPVSTPVSFSYVLSRAALDLNSYLVNKFRDEQPPKQ